MNLFTIVFSLLALCVAQAVDMTSWEIQQVGTELQGHRSMQRCPLAFSLLETVDGPIIKDSDGNGNIDICASEISETVAVEFRFGNCYDNSDITLDYTGFDGVLQTSGVPFRFYLGAKLRPFTYPFSGGSNGDVTLVVLDC